MGVAGCGKTTVGRALADALGLTFHDADDFHPEANVAKMRSGTPLTDADRWPWLETLSGLLREPVVLACSALKESYRTRLSLGGSPVFVYLRITPETATARLQARADHFMPSSLIKSQFETLEEPDSAIVLDAELSLADEIEVCLEALRRQGLR